MAKTSINLNELYQSFLTQFGGDAVQAGQYTAFQRLANPTGSMTGLDVAKPWFSKTKWYERDAPNYNSVINFKGDTATLDKLTKYTVETLRKPEYKNFTLTDASSIASKGRDSLVEAGITVQDYYNQLKDLLAEKTRAENSYQAQVSTHPFALYGLNPELRYGVVADKANNIVEYQPALKYVIGKRNAYVAELIARGASAANAREASKSYEAKLIKLIDAKITASGISPFLEQVASKTRARK